MRATHLLIAIVVAAVLVGLGGCGRQAVRAAEKEFRAALAAKSDYAEAHNGLGAALSLQGKITEARTCYERALALKPCAAPV